MMGMAFLCKDEGVRTGGEIDRQRWNVLLDLLRGKWGCIVGVAEAGFGASGAPVEEVMGSMALSKVSETGIF